MEIRDADDFVRAHQKMVARQAWSIARRWRGHIEMEDLLGVGLLAAMNAARRFDVDRDIPLVAHTARAARWAMLSEARTSALVRRGVVDRRRALLAAEARVEQRNGRAATSDEVAVELGVDPDRVEQWRQQGAALERVPIVDLEATLCSNERAPEEHVLREEMLDALRAAIVALPPKLRWVVGATYFENRPLASVAAELGVSESRISQLRAEAVALLRDGLRVLLDSADAGDATDRAHAVSNRPTRRQRSYRAALRDAARAS